MNYDWTKDRWSEANPSEPLTDAELDALRSTLTFYGRASLIPRLVATIDAHGCRCDECRAANMAYMAMWRSRRRAAKTHRLLHGRWLARDDGA